MCGSWKEKVRRILPTDEHSFLAVQDVIRRIGEKEKMSSTGRSNVRRIDDMYETPAWATKLILPKIDLSKVHSILEPAAGGGAIARLINTTGPTHLVEINDFWCETLKKLYPQTVVFNMNFLLFTTANRYDLIITNPPFTIAQEFVEKALSLRSETGLVVMLLRLSFLESQKRVAFHRKHPSAVYVLPKRPSFTGTGTDSCAYAWFVWGSEKINTWEIL